MTADYFNQWYADIGRSERRQALFTDVLGVPPEVGPSNLVPLDGLREIAAALQLPEDSELVDFACGRGGPGMWIARELGAELVGVDFSAEAVAQASERRALFDLAERATFAVGTLDDTGLPAGSADGVICIDAFQFSADQLATASEMRRVLRPGGTVVLTSWEAVDRSYDRIGERLRNVDLGAALTEAGFRDVTVMEKSDWHEVGRRLNEAAAAVDPTGDPALESFHNEALRTLPNHDQLRRVMATATAP